MNDREYLLQCYAAWLGKVVGIRLGAYVEGWDSERIEREFPCLDGYPVDFGIFAADDDSNGPLFFVRALLDGEKPTTQSVADAFLDYISEYHGFFWWGGVGISTEHTAFENLKNGIPAPKSGSAGQNGIAVAEQIGGQIFSDCWGYVSGGRPWQAARLARTASSVSHDKNGIQGGIFVATAISLAFKIKDAKKIINRALLFLDPRMEYSKVVRDVRRFCEQNNSDWRAARDYVKSRYGYDRYPGVCHIIPNAAAMIAALCCGENDFSKTLCILCRFGWDTDCNCGNVGSIMGAMNGLAGIDERWSTPINDVMVCSSAVGYLNNQTVCEGSRMFADIAKRLSRRRSPTTTPPETVYNFSLPRETCGFFGDGCEIRGGDGLHVNRNGEHSQIYKFSYFLPDDLYDNRYEPSFSPLVYPGETVSAVIAGEGRARLFWDSADGMRYAGGISALTAQGVVMSLEIPPSNETVRRFGVEFVGAGRAVVKRISIDKKARFGVDFAVASVDDYGTAFGGDNWSQIRGFTTHSGRWTLEKGLLVCRGKGLITTGDVNFGEFDLDFELPPVECGLRRIVFWLRGARRYYAAEFANGCVRLVKCDTGKRIVLAESARCNQIVTENRFTIRARYDKISIDENGNSLLEAPLSGPPPRGCLGFGCDGGVAVFKGFKLTSF